MAREQFIKIRNLIEKEFSHAVTKHPKFCDHFIDESARTWAEQKCVSRPGTLDFHGGKTVFQKWEKGTK